MTTIVIIAGLLILLFLAAAGLGPGLLAAVFGIPWQLGLAIIALMIAYILFR